MEKCPILPMLNHAEQISSILYKNIVETRICYLHNMFSDTRNTMEDEF